MVTLHRCFSSFDAYSAFADDKFFFCVLLYEDFLVYRILFLLFLFLCVRAFCCRIVFCIKCVLEESKKDENAGWLSSDFCFTFFVVVVHSSFVFPLASFSIPNLGCYWRKHSLKAFYHAEKHSWLKWKSSEALHKQMEQIYETVRFNDLVYKHSLNSIFVLFVCEQNVQKKIK